MKAELFLASRYLFRGRAKHVSFIGIISCVGVALGVATLVVVISVMNGFDRDLMARLLQFNDHITIEAGDSEKIPQIQETLRLWPEVKSVAPFVQTQVFGKFDKIVFPLMVKGIDLSDEQEAARFAPYIKEDRGTEGFFVGQGLQQRFGIYTNLEYYPLQKQLRLKETAIRGVFAVGLYDIDQNFLIADIELAKKLSENYLLFLGARIDKPLEVDAVKEKIQKAFPAGVFVTSWIDSNKHLFSALKLEKLVMFTILSLIILVASFNIFATLSVKVVEKTKDIGVLKALGFTPRHILSIFTLQGLLLGFIGVLSGTALGVGVCLFVQKYPVIRLPEDIYSIDYLPIALNYPDLMLIGAVGLVLAFFSSLAPALKASRLSPCEALRYE